MYETQKIEIKNSIDLSDVPLKQGKEIEIFAESETCESSRRYIKLVNVSGKIVIFIEGVKDVSINEWKGVRESRKVLMNIEDDMYVEDK